MRAATDRDHPCGNGEGHVQHRNRHGRSKVSLSCVQDFMARCNEIQTFKPETVPQSFAQKRERWESGRLNYAYEMLERRFRTGIPSDPGTNPEFIGPLRGPPICLGAVCWADERSQYVIIGHAQTHAKTVARSAAGDLTAHIAGGTSTEKPVRMNVKNPGSSCGMFCTAMRKRLNPHEYAQVQETGWRPISELRELNNLGRWIDVDVTLKERSPLGLGIKNVEGGGLVVSRAEKVRIFPPILADDELLIRREFVDVGVYVEGTRILKVQLNEKQEWESVTNIEDFQRVLQADASYPLKILFQKRHFEDTTLSRWEGIVTPKAPSYHKYPAPGDFGDLFPPPGHECHDDFAHPYSPFYFISICKYQEFKDKELKKKEKEAAADLEKKIAAEKKVREERKQELEAGNDLCICEKCGFWGDSIEVERHKKSSLCGMKGSGVRARARYEAAQKDRDKADHDRQYEGWKKRMLAKKQKKRLQDDEANAYIDNPAALNPDEFEAFGLRPFDYTIDNSGQRWIFGYSTFTELVLAEMARVLKKRGNWGREGSGYKERYPGLDEFGVPNWQRELYKNMRDSSSGCKKAMCACEMQLHQIKVGNEFYAGTEAEGKWTMFHDALGAWGQPFLRALGFEHRQMIACTANRGIARLENSIPGNTPGGCRGLDTHGFARLNVAYRMIADLTKSFYGQARAAHLQDIIFHSGTPMQMKESLERCWSYLEGDKFVQDILGFDRFWKLVQERKGGPLREEEKRSGRRYISVQEGRAGDLRRKPRARQRKATIKSGLPNHPDLKGFLDLIREEMDEMDFEAYDSMLENFATQTAEDMDDDIGEIFLAV